MRQPPRSLRRIRDQIAAGTVGALAQRYQQGKIKYRVDVVGGLENAPKALNLEKAVAPSIDSKLRG